MKVERRGKAVIVIIYQVPESCRLIRTKSSTAGVGDVEVEVESQTRGVCRDVTCKYRMAGNGCRLDKGRKIVGMGY